VLDLTVILGTNAFIPETNADAATHEQSFTKCYF
jgi:hypothetical protein